MKRIAIINGPNLNLLGKREPEIYGYQTFEEYFEALKRDFPQLDLIYKQSNVEGDLVNFIQEYGFISDGIIINAGAYSHTSIAIADALSAVEARIIEVHISNIFAREEYRHHSFVTPRAKGLICGLGLQGYQLAIHSLIA